MHQRITGYQVLLGLVAIFIINSPSVAQPASKLKLTSCDTGEAISDVIVFDVKSGKRVGYSDTKGEVMLKLTSTSNSVELKFYKMIALDTTVVIESDIRSLCLYEKKASLAEVEIAVPNINLNEVFERFIQKTVEKLCYTDTILYYAYEYQVFIPDSGWSMDVSGKLRMPAKSYEISYSGAFGATFCSLNIEMDSALYNASDQKKLSVNYILFDVLYQYDFMRKKFPYRRQNKYSNVLQKTVKEDFTQFTHFTKAFRGTKKVVSYPIFNEDSLLVRNRYELAPEIDPVSGKPLRNFGYEDGTIYYEMQSNGLVRTGIEANFSFISKAGVKFRIKSMMRLIDDTPEDCMGLDITTTFDKASLLKIPISAGYLLELR